jgi:hypothetical protein
VASAFCVGNVLISRYSLDDLLQRPTLLVHEERHSWQYLLLAGPFYWPCYGVAMVWSLLRTGDRGSANPFEIAAGLADGGYRELPRRTLPQMVSAVRRAPHTALRRLNARARRRGH